MESSVATKTVAADRGAETWLRSLRVHSRHVRVALAVVIAVIAGVHVFYYFPRVVDDLFISLRYAENLVRGNGAVYNVGERVEGYSSPLWMLVQALGLALGIEGVLATKILGVVSLALLFLGVHRLARDVLRLGPWLSLVPLASLAANSYVVDWAVLGLETPLHLAAMVWAAVALRSFGDDQHDAISDRRATLLAATSLVVLGSTRPESPLLLALLVVESIVVAPRSSWRARLRVRRNTLLVTAAALTAALAVRWFYYHDLFANTYYVKGANSHFALSKLRPLYAEGSGVTERVVLVAGTLLLGMVGWIRRRLGPFAIAMAVLFFTCKVEVDWMPSLRHLLPITILAPVGCAMAVDVLTESPADADRGKHLAAAFGIVLVVGAAGADVARLDSRLSVLEAEPGHFRKLKSREKWDDAVLAFRRIEPPHVRAMGTYEMGQITQAWGVLEASAEPVASSWFAGRDIGALGYYTGVRVFDTAGLVTREVSHAAPWQNGHQVTSTMVREMMLRRPVAGEVYEGWDTALGAERALLDGYRIRFGTRSQPHGFVATDRVPPTPREMLARYEQFASKFPTAFHLHTLYGESVGAAVEKRLRVIREGAHETRDR